MPRKLKCRHCGEYEEDDKGIRVPLGFFCSMAHVSEYGLIKAKAAQDRKRKRADKVIEEASKADRRQLKHDKESIKRPQEFLDEAQKAVNTYIRIRDFFLGCPSCNKTKEEVETNQGWKVGGCWDAGHYMPRGAKGQLRFNLLNIHKQCKSCNGGSDKFSHKAASVSEIYRVNIIKKIGLERVEWLENNNELEVDKFDIERLKRIKRIFAKRARHYKKRRGI